MNIVFWLLIFVALAGIWLMFSPLFKDIGDIATNIVEDTKEQMSEASDKNYKEEEN